MRLENILDIVTIFKKRKHNKRIKEELFFKERFLECSTCRFRTTMHDVSFEYDSCILTGEEINCVGCSGYKVIRRYRKYMSEDQSMYR